MISRPHGFRVQPWDPSFGSEMSAEEDFREGRIEVDTGIELPPRQWRPVSPPRAQGPHLAFVDGVRRIDAWALFTAPSGLPSPAILASIATGACICQEQARIEEIQLQRVLLSAESNQRNLPANLKEYRFVATEESGPAGLLNGLRQTLREQEHRTAAAIPVPAIVVLDGPLSGSPPDSRRVLGYVKSHRAQYLSGAEEQTLLTLEPGQRTPLFLIQGDWPRYSFYLRLPGNLDGGPWSGLCRLEISTENSIDELVPLANLAAFKLPTFASRPHREARAPQNLYPIAGLEQVLRSRLGDSLMLYRRILQTARIEI